MLRGSPPGPVLAHAFACQDRAPLLAPFRDLRVELGKALIFGVRHVTRYSVTFSLAQSVKVTHIRVTQSQGASHMPAPTVAVHEWKYADGVVAGCGTVAEHAHWTAEGTLDGVMLGGIIGFEPASEDARRAAAWARIAA